MLATGTKAFSPIEHTIVRYHVLAAQALERERNPSHADDKVIGQKWYGALARAATQAVVKRREQTDFWQAIGKAYDEVSEAEVRLNAILEKAQALDSLAQHLAMLRR
eukprot:3423164-Prymnesium_polylepis.2